MNATDYLAGLTDHQGSTVFDALRDHAGRPALRAALAWLVVLLAALALTGAFLAAASASHGTV